MLLEYHLKELKLPTFLREYGKMAGVCAAEGVDHPGYLLRLSELELIDRHHRMVERRIKAGRFPATKSLDTFDILVMQLARCEYVSRRENVIAVGNSGTGKTHVALGLGRAATAQPAEEACPAQAAHRRRTRLRPAVQDRSGAAVRGLQPALRERVDHGHDQPALRRVD